MLSPSARPCLISTASPLTMPGVTRRSSTLPSWTTSRRAKSPSRVERRRGSARAVPAREFDLARGEGADMGVADVLERDPHLAGSARPVDLLVDKAHAARDRVPYAGQLQFRRHAERKAGERLFGHVGLEVDGSVLDDAEQRFAGARSGGARLGRSPADQAGHGRLTSVRSMRTSNSWRSASRLFRSA